jgi:hypothetical protein
MGRRLSHLEEAGETYFEHLRFAWSVGFVMLVHGLLPFVWEFKATEMMSRREIQRREKLRRGRSGYE